MTEVLDRGQPGPPKAANSPATKDQGSVPESGADDHESGASPVHPRAAQVDRSEGPEQAEKERGSQGGPGENQAAQAGVPTNGSGRDKGESEETPKETEAPLPVDVAGVKADVRGTARDVLTIGHVDRFFLNQEETGRLEDPTQELQARPSELQSPVLSSSQVGLWREQITLRRVAILTCPDGDILLGAAYDLLEDPSWQRLEHRFLDLATRRSPIAIRPDEDRAKKGEGAFILRNLPLRAGKGCVILIQLGSAALDDKERVEEADPRLEVTDTLFGPANIYQAIRDALEERDLFLLVLVDTRYFYEAIERRRRGLGKGAKEERFFHATVPYLPILLNRALPGSPSSDLVTLLERRLGVDGADGPENIFERFDRAYQLLQEPDNLETELRRWSESEERIGREQDDRIVRESTGAVFMLTEQTIGFDTAKPVHQEVLFCAAFFPDLGHHEFEILVGLLLADRTVGVTEETEELNEEGEVRTLRRTVQRPLKQIWDEDADKILRECSLAVVTRADQREVIDFEDSALRNHLVSEFRRHHAIFLRQKLAVIHRTGLIFRLDLSEVLCQDIVQFTVGMILADRTHYRRSWLAEFVTGMHHLLQIEVPDSVTFEQFWIIVHAAEDHARIYSLFIARLSRVLREMIQHEPLRQIVHESLDQVLGNRRHDDALRLVLEISKRLRSAHHFDALFWLRRLMDEGPEETAGLAYQSLLHQVAASGVATYTILETVRDWLPAEDRGEPPARPSSYFALRLLLELATESSRRFELSRWGDRPTRYPLFTSLSADSAESRERLRMLARWLFHPALKHVVASGDEPVEQALCSLRAEILERWYAILVGLEERAAGGAALARDLLEAVVATTDRQEQDRLMSAWRSRRQVYLVLRDRTQHREIDLRSRLHALRSRSLELESEFQQIRRAIPPIRQEVIAS